MNADKSTSTSTDTSTPVRIACPIITRGDDGKWYVLRIDWRQA